MSDLDRHAALVRWMVDNKVELSNVVRLGPSELGGIGVFATKKIDPQTVLLSVPKDQVLSPRTCGIADLLEEYELDGMIGLTVAYMFELGLGEGSPWCEFLNSFDFEPSEASLPRFWEQNEQEWLQGTEVEAMGGMDVSEVKEAYEELIAPFMETYKHHFRPDLRNYESYAKSLMVVCSRAFEVDNFRGLSLVPGACLFNHSDNEHVHFEADGSVCDMCGAFGFCEHDTEVLEAEAEEQGEKQFEEIETDDLIPELIEDDDWQDVDGDEEYDDEEGEEEDQGDEDDDDEDNGTCDIRTIRPIARGDEIFNTYGEHSNGVLLSRYGFAIWDNHHETVSLAPEIVSHCKVTDISGRLKWWKANYQFIYEDAEDLEDMEDIPDWLETTEVFSTGQPSFGLVVLLNMLTMTPKKFMLANALVSRGKYDVPRTLSPDAKDLLKKLIQKRLKRYHDGSMTSKDYLKLLENDLSPRQRLAAIVRGTEKLVLERTRKSLK
uniref:Ribosomal lysine N-methyltransferase 4 n=1 Tax=Blastobotrys adeninivorans TaxID=409370 RepID=A0A060T064_BLAAD